MTTDRAIKKAARARRAITGESYREARAKVAQQAAQPLIVRALAANGSWNRIHAVLHHPEGRARSPRFPYFRAICGMRGTDAWGWGGFRAAEPRGVDGERVIETQHGAAVIFDPDAKHERDSFCDGCLRAWREHYGPQSAESKACARCGAIKPLTKFPRHSSSADGVAKTCSECKRQQKEDAEKAERDARHAELIAAMEAHNARWSDAIAGYQASDTTQSFTCQRGHQLAAAVAGDRITGMKITWHCPCGSTAFTQQAADIVSAWETFQRQVGAPEHSHLVSV